MTDGDFLLDTNIAVALFRSDAVASRHLAAARAVFSTAVVVGELCYGAEKSNRPADERRLIDGFVRGTPLLPQDLDVAEVYGRLKNDLRRRGRPIPDNDLWIAAAAVRHGLTLASRDRHFEAVTGLSLDRWDT